VPKLYFNEQQIHETITIVLGDDGMVADEVIACLKKDMNEHLESQADTFIQSETDRIRGK